MFPIRTEEQFNECIEKISYDTGMYSDLGMIKRHDWYPALKDSGRSILPFVFRRLESDIEGGNWICVILLADITGANPIPREDYGRLIKIREHWINWGHENGYKW